MKWMPITINQHFVNSMDSILFFCYAAIKWVRRAYKFNGGLLLRLLTKWSEAQEWCFERCECIATDMAIDVEFMFVPNLWTKYVIY